MKQTTHLILILLFIAGTALSAQQPPSLDDTLKINDVIIKGKRDLRFSGFSRTEVDTALLRDYINWSLSDILRSGSSLFVKSYGPGGIATLSLRGAGASHTVVTWNGISLNSPMLGQSDLLLIPSVVADEVNIYNGGASVAMSQGGLGGVVATVTRASWNSPSTLEVSASAGGYGRYAASMVGKYGGDRWRFATRLNYGFSENDFVFVNTYLTNESLRSKRENAGYLQKVAVQEAWHRTSNSVTGFKLWAQETSRDIPSPVNISQSSHDEHLSTRNIRGFVTHDRYYTGNISWSSSVAYLNDQIDYRDNVTGISSLSFSDLFTVRSSLLVNEGQRTALKANFSTELASVTNESYLQNQSRQVTGVSISADHGLSSFADLNANVVITAVDWKLIHPDVSAGIEIKPIRDRSYSLRANMALKSRIPTFNDLYWIPGGNQSLRTERAFNSEVSMNMDDQLGLLMLSGSAALFYNSIENMIIWKPAAGGLWSPVNSGEILARGLDSRVSVEYRKNDHYLTLVTSYTYTSSIDVTSGRQQIYVPLQTARVGLRGASGLFMAGVACSYTGKRFITADNDQYLPSYSVSDIWLGVRYSVNGFPGETTIRFENFFFTGYQVVAYHPMPLGSIIINSSVKLMSGKRK